MEIPVVTTERLLLRPFVYADIERLHLILSNENVIRFLPNPIPPTYGRVTLIVERILKDWEQHGYGLWAVEETKAPGLIGWCGLQYLSDTDETEVAYLLDEPAWGKGFATEGAKASLQYGFGQLALKRIIAIVHLDNDASRHVIEKLGMRFVDQTRYFGIDCYRYAADRVAPTQGM